jgi:hypothetical protein
MAPTHSRTLGVFAVAERGAREMAAFSRAALDRPLACAAELFVSIATDDALLVGAYQRPAGWGRDLLLLRRGSGGPEVRVGPGTVHVALCLEHPAALMTCDEKRVVNRHVRPLLRALSSTGSLAHFFGRDWVSVAHTPVAWVGFAHDSASRRTLFEAFVAVRAPFAVRERTSLRGKPPGTLEATRGSAIDVVRLTDAIVEAYGRERAVARLDDPASPGAAGPQGPGYEADLVDAAEPPWAATVEEAIGTLGAGPDARGVFRVGGDLLVSRDALALLEERVARASDEDLPAVIDATLAAPGVALDGVRSLASVLDVVSRARHG